MWYEFLFRIKISKKHHLTVDKDHGIPSAAKFDSFPSMIKLNVDEPLKIWSVTAMCTVIKSVNKVYRPRYAGSDDG